MHRGYLALWRKIKDHPFYNEPRVFSKYEAWLDLLMEAQHEEEPKEVVIGMDVLTCHHGETLRSTRNWAARWKWSEAKVRRFLKLLKKMGQIDFKSEGKTTRIFIVNYASYDPKRRKHDADATQDRRKCDAQPATNNNEKNEKNVNNTKSPDGDSSPEEAPETFPETSPESPRGPPKCPQERIKAIYHEELPELPPIRVWGEASRKNLRTRWREDPDRQSPEWWRQFFREYIRSSDFLMGRKRDFQASLDWIVEPRSFQKIMNGRYVNRNGNGGSSRSDRTSFSEKYKDYDDLDEVTDYV